MTKNNLIKKCVITWVSFLPFFFKKFLERGLEDDG